MTAEQNSNKTIVVIGDVHHHIQHALEALQQLELETPIDQIFSVGDFGLFLQPHDWEFLTGPSKYRQPEESPKIKRALSKWKWSTAMIAGNHEPFNRLRVFDPGYYSYKINYTNAGIIEHSIAQLTVTGLSGIFKPTELEFMSELEARQLKISKPTSWEEMVALVEQKKISRSRLTYYKETEIETVKNLRTPDIMLLHDWPITPEHVRFSYNRRPEKEIVEKAQPKLLCCGHHHTAAKFQVGSTTVFALNILGELGKPHKINKGWAMVVDWNGSQLSNARHWPAL